MHRRSDAVNHKNKNCRTVVRQFLFLFLRAERFRMRSAFALRMFSGNTIYTFVVPERLRTLRYYIFMVEVVKESYILCHHPYEHCAAGRFSLQNILDYVILSLPH